MVRPSSLKLPNKFLRKHRKWPLSPYKTKWHRNLNQQQAMQALKQAAERTTSAPPQENPSKHQQHHLLSTLIHSFNTYNCHPTPSAYHLVIKTLATTSQFHHIPPVLDHLEQVEKFETPECVFAELIGIYGNADKLREAVELFYGIPKFRCVPSVYSLNSLLSVLCGRSEGLRMVPQVLVKSQRMNIRVEESTFRILIGALCKIRRVGYAIELMNCVINDGYDIDVRICSLILSSLCEQNDMPSDAVMGFVKIMGKQGFSPGMIDYSTLIRFLVKKGKGVQALDILNTMKVEGIKPDIVCYTMVLHGVITEGHYERADEFGELSRMRVLLKEMGQKGVESNFRTYRIMLEGLVSKGEIIEASVLLEEMLERRFCTSRCATVDEVVLGLCQRGFTCKAVELVQKLVDKNVAPGAMAWEALLLSSGSKLTFSETILTGLVKVEPQTIAPI
ncbi:hypothetical protein CJ030_MR2G016413 [Morella rubra]|uniref:Pentacotripeptide-repeat region of PRORP domain-containing protein n=1 Tax=Morella rubra TaxID=262757 RepID=A0A6A1WH46_9ROSI|nr:hypothetical protein CJ030_MR2G016413 [Morella rubra]